MSSPIYLTTDDGTKITTDDGDFIILGYTGNFQKRGANWRQNVAHVNNYVYDPTTGTYDTMYPVYDGVLSTPINTKKRGTFTKTNKTRGNWQRNPAGNANLRPYDSATQVYDSATIQYDGLTANEPIASTKKRTSWTK